MEELQSTLFNHEIDLHKELVRQSVQLSEDRIREILVPVLNELEEGFIQYYMRVRDARESGKIHNNMLEEQRRRATNFENLKDVLLDFPHFFEKIVGDGYEAPLFQENLDLFNLFENLNARKYNKMKNGPGRNIFHKNYSPNLSNRVVNKVLPLISPYSTLRDALLFSDKTMHGIAERALEEVWQVLLDNGYPDNWSRKLEKLNRAKFSEQMKKLKTRWSKVYPDSEDYKLGKFNPQGNLKMDVFLNETDPGDGANFANVVTPKVIHNGIEDIYIFKIDSYEKFGEPSSVEKYYRSEIKKLRNTLEALKDSSDVMGTVVETKNRFLESNPEFRIVVEFLEKSGVHVLDKLTSLQYPADVYNYVVGEVIPKYNAHNPEITKIFSGIIEKSLERLRKNQAVESLRSYGAKVSPDEIIASPFIELWSKLGLTQRMNSRIRHFEENLSKISKYKIKINPRENFLNYS